MVMEHGPWAPIDIIHADTNGVLAYSAAFMGTVLWKEPASTNEEMTRKASLLIF